MSSFVRLLITNDVAGTMAVAWTGRGSATLGGARPLAAAPAGLGASRPAPPVAVRRSWATLLRHGTFCA